MGDECTLCACSELGDPEVLLAITGGLGGVLLRCGTAGFFGVSAPATLLGLACCAALVPVCRCGDEKFSLPPRFFLAGFGGGVLLDGSGGKLLDIGTSSFAVLCCISTGELLLCSL